MIFHSPGLRNFGSSTSYRTYLAANEEESFFWRQSYITMFLERDIPNLGFQIPPQQMRRFWLMLVHYHGQIFNAHELGKKIGYEFKYTDAPKITPSMRIASEDLKLDHLYVIYPGKETYALSETITVRVLMPPK